MSNLSPSLLQQFLNQKVEVTERIEKLTLRGKERSFVTIEVVDNDPTIAALKTAAEAEGLYLRVFTPGTMGTMDWQTDRLNVIIEKSPDGSYYHIDRLTIG